VISANISGVGLAFHAAVSLRVRNQASCAIPTLAAITVGRKPARAAARARPRATAAPRDRGREAKPGAWSAARWWTTAFRARVERCRCKVM